MKSLLLVILLAAAASAAVVSNKVPDVVELPALADGEGGVDVDVNEKPKVADVDELATAAEMLGQTAAAAPRLSEGIIGPTDKLLFNSTFNGQPNVIGIHGDITIRVRSKITAIRGTPVVPSQYVHITIVSGGVGSYQVTFRIRTAAGRGYSISMQVYGESVPNDKFL